MKTQKKGSVFVHFMGVAALAVICCGMVMASSDFSFTKAKTYGAKADLDSYETMFRLVSVEENGLDSLITLTKTEAGKRLFIEKMNEKLDARLDLMIDDNGYIRSTEPDPWGERYYIYPYEEQSIFLVSSSGQNVNPDTDYAALPEESDLTDDLCLVVQKNGNFKYGFINNDREQSLKTPEVPTVDPDPIEEQVPEKTWDISEDKDKSVIASLYKNLDHPGYYDLRISGKGKMKDWSKDSSGDYHSKSYKNFILSVTVEDGITNIGEAFLAQFKMVQIVTLPVSITEIEEEAFYYCKNLNMLSIKGSSPENNCFVIPGSVKKIEESAFENCDGLFTLNILPGMKEIEEDAFKNCKFLSSAYLPYTIQDVDDDSFENCFNLSTIYVDQIKNTLENSPWGAKYANVQWK